MTAPWPRQRPVLIVGAGLTGLTLAAALRRRGIPVRIVDHRAQRVPITRAIGIQARTMEVFERLGVSPALTSAALPIKGQAFHFPDRTVVSPFHGVHPRHPAMLILPQSHVEDQLESCVAHVEWACRFSGMAGLHDALLTHADGSVEVCEAEWIVGCDGAQSGVRNAMGIEPDMTGSDARILLGDCRLEGLDPEMVHFFTDQSMLGFAAPDGLWRLVAILPPGPPDPFARDMTAFHRLGIELPSPAWRSSFSVVPGRASRFRVGRMLLAGDAARIHSPADSPGMNVGIQDAWWLAGAIEYGEPSVEQWRREGARVAGKVESATHRTTCAMLFAPSWMAGIRGAALRLAARSDWFCRFTERNVAGMHDAPIGCTP